MATHENLPAPESAPAAKPAPRWRVPFFVRIGAFGIGLVLLSTAISTALAYRSNKQALEAALGAELLAIVKTLAGQIHGDLLPLIQAGMGNRIEGLDEFHEFQNQLRIARDGNDLRSDGSPLYLMRPAPDFERTQQLEFVVMTDPNETGDYFVGNLYPAKDHNLRALAGEAVATRIYTDAHGAWISACAPVHDRHGNIVAILQADRTVDFFFAQARHQADGLILGSLVGIVLAGLAAVPFARSLARPVRALATATRRFAAGQLEHRVHLDRRDELGDLGQRFNDMATDLQAAHHRDEAQQNALRQSLAEVQAAARAKDQFLATMSHEVRTPMNAIMGFNHILSDTPLTPEQRDCVETIGLSAEGLLVLLNDMLDFAKIESNTVAFEAVPFDLVPQLERALKLIALDAKAKHLDLNASFDPRLPTRVRGDPDRLRQVVLNLLANAVKFTDQGSILLRVDLIEQDDDAAVVAIAVTDTGIGIDPADTDRLFQPFSQVDGSSTRRFGGVGLGLAIAQRLVHHMHGKFTVESEPGAGSTFRFSARFEVVNPEPAPPAPAPVPTVDAPPIALPVAIRVLVVEDNLVNQKLAKRVVQKCGCQVETADDGRAGCERHAATPFDLILMDLQMPVMDGLAATRAIRAAEAARGGTTHVPIIAVTANAMPGDDQRCFDAGMDLYLTKPFNAAKLTAAVRQLADARLSAAITDGA